MPRNLRRLAAIFLSAIVAVPAAAVLYLAFGDLSRHKGRIEALVAQQTGRSFAIDGALELQVLPSISVVAERVRLANADWGSQPQMIELGRVSVRIGLWSLFSGPVDVRSFEVRDLSVLLETGPEGQGNWVLGAASAPEEAAAEPGASAPALPPVIQNGKLANVRITYRERGKPDRVAFVETFAIGPGTAGLLAISGKGSLDEFPASVSGELGPLDALFSGRDIRIAIEAGVGDLRLDVKGGIGRFDPLDGADLAVKLGHPDIGAMLKKLDLPVIASGALVAEVKLADAGDLTRLDVAAKLADITLSVEGTLRALGLPGSDLRVKGSVANLERLAAALDVAGLPAGALEFGGRLTASRAEINLDGMNARFAGARARVDGTLRPARGSADLRFELAAESLAKLRAGLPETPLSMSGTYAGSRDKLEVKSLKGKIGESEFSARASMAGSKKKRVDIELASPRLDLTPLVPDSKAKPKPKPKEAARKYVFDEAPLPLDKLKLADAKLRFSSAEVRLGTEILRDVESTLLLEGGRLTLEGRATDNFGGTIRSAVKLTPADDGSGALSISVSAKNVRFSLGAGDAIDPKDAPPTSVEASLLVKGASARQMAAGANGRVVVTQGAGKLSTGVVGLIGGDLLRELAGKLNPFSAQDPYTQLECTVVRADILDGQVAVKPVLMQSVKVTIVAGGKVDLGTEALRFDFNTRPRTGVGITAGMFANPFIELAGTLASPKLGVGAKGATSGAAAVATGGISVFAQGMLDRVRGTQDLCKKTLEESAAKSK
ncbi:MAG TPA: AsmA family protein [Burkholderiales bacterium]|jgi:hypothetical protein